MKRLSDDAIQMLNDRAEERKDLAKAVPYLAPILLFVSSFYFPVLWFITGPLILVAVVWSTCKFTKFLYTKSIKVYANAKRDGELDTLIAVILILSFVAYLLLSKWGVL